MDPDSDYFTYLDDQGRLTSSLNLAKCRREKWSGKKAAEVAKAASRATMILAKATVAAPKDPGDEFRLKPSDLRRKPDREREKRVVKLFSKLDESDVSLLDELVLDYDDFKEVVAGQKRVRQAESRDTWDGSERDDDPDRRSGEETSEGKVRVRPKQYELRGAEAGDVEGPRHAEKGIFPSAQGAVPVDARLITRPVMTLVDEGMKAMAGPRGLQLSKQKDEFTLEKHYAAQKALRRKIVEPPSPPEVDPSGGDHSFSGRAARRIARAEKLRGR